MQNAYEETTKISLQNIRLTILQIFFWQIQAAVVKILVALSTKDYLPRRILKESNIGLSNKRHFCKDKKIRL